MDNSKRKGKRHRLLNAFLIVLFFILASLQYKVICVLILALVNKGRIKEWYIVRNHRWFYPIILVALTVAFALSLPNYFQRGRTRLEYIDQSGKQMSIPLDAYVSNVVFPEIEIMNAGILGTAFFPIQSATVSGHKIGGGLLSDAKQDFWKGKLISFYTPFLQLRLHGSDPGSAAIGQFLNEKLGRKYDPIYITYPRHWNKGEEYPLVVFCHGYLGNWEMYQGLLSSLDNCFVLSIGTKDLSGLFKNSDISAIFTRYIPYLLDKGIKIDKQAIHLIGLSNGGTAANYALNSYSGRFKSITFLSTGCHTIKYAKSRILLVGGANDSSSSSLPGAKKALDQCGTDCRLLYIKDTDHFLMATNRKEMIQFLKEGMDLQ